MHNQTFVTGRNRPGLMAHVMIRPPGVAAAIDGGIRCRQGTPVWKNYKKWIAIGFHSYHQSIPWESILHHLSLLTKSLETPSLVILGMDSPVTSRNGTLHPQTLRTPQNRFSLKEASNHISVSLSARGKLLVAFLSLD